MCLFNSSILNVEYLKDKLFLERLGKHLKKIRKQNGYTQEKLAFKIGIEISQISRIERGILNTSVSLIHAIAKELNVHTKDMFDFD
ncbi:helix-turn-helix domain-containing protein [Bizionia sp.]|uniref:helix-turn-helix domain-containing protein n=1 Tax=Bizionia sp. TaxID=1954480 RepID=UPI003A944A04